MMSEHDQEGKKMTSHFLNQEQSRGMDEVTEYEGNVMLNGGMYRGLEADGEAMMGDLGASNEAYCVGDACPTEKGAKATNQMILDSYRVPSPYEE